MNDRAMPDVQDEEPDLIGPVRRTLRDLGVTDPDVLQHGTDLDRASERLIIKAAEEAGTRNPIPDNLPLSRSKGSAELINHAFASGDPGAAGLLRRSGSCERQSPEAEP